MRKDAIWNESIGCYTAPDPSPAPKRVKYDITNCYIKITALGFYYLYVNDYKIRELSDREFMKYRGLVKGIIGEELLL